MAKWSAILVILMVVIVVVAVEAKWSEKDFSDPECYRKCIKSCRKHDGDCFEFCRVVCPNPRHSSSRRISHGMESVEVLGRRK
ncbi:uncharacterized protein LOC110229641 isoform X1 [Arabidopsis lyrata subsp. lyrata]|uniref:uncharacterized protein LOC110229641 isoform X1 n=1 Tax=Arabidopsis lyrata subsp. lyrata TaxID=81972 RepID=UPI000A29C65E|nr:uncharacterized protein LOC110229641 isoform X1 [Arabidopsis lyrata subsp. lyrata]|eukprot:XP_020885904.1 uncharacterized protein LOC110229641 isoform X1 [Arabidopsis lyrata subsp. lyrata]